MLDHYPELMLDAEKVAGKKATKKRMSDACWKGYEAVGTKKKGNRVVPNCVPSSEKKAAIEYHGKTFPGYNQPIASDRANKKKMVLAKKGDKVKLIHFGQKGYKHNYSDAAKKNYLSRSAGIKGKGGKLTKDDKFSANYWARRVLWPKGKADGSAKTKQARELSRFGGMSRGRAKKLMRLLSGAMRGGRLGFA